MNGEFLHDWEPHYWRSNQTQALKGYRECRRCGRLEWLDGRVEELAGGMSEEEFEEARRRVILGQPVPWLEDDASAGEQGADADDTC